MQRRLPSRGLRCHSLSWALCHQFSQWSWSQTSYCSLHCVTEAGSVDSAARFSDPLVTAVLASLWSSMSRIWSSCVSLWGCHWMVKTIWPNDQARPGPGHGDKTSPLNETTEPTVHSTLLSLSCSLYIHLLYNKSSQRSAAVYAVCRWLPRYLSRISYAYVSITKSVGSNQLSTQQFGLGRIYSTQHFLVELVWTFRGSLFPFFSG